MGSYRLLITVYRLPLCVFPQLAHFGREGVGDGLLNVAIDYLLDTVENGRNRDFGKLRVAVAAAPRYLILEFVAGELVIFEVSQSEDAFHVVA